MLHGLSAARSPLWRERGTRKSRLETKTENEASSALLARLWGHLILQNRANGAEISPVSAVPQLDRLGGGCVAADKAIVQWVQVPPCQLPASGT